MEMSENEIGMNCNAEAPIFRFREFLKIKFMFITRRSDVGHP